MTMLTQAEKRRMRQGLTITLAPPVPGMQIIVTSLTPITTVYANVQRDNIVSKIKFGKEARELLPSLAALWDNGN